MGWRGSGEVELVLEVVLVLPLPLQAGLLPEAGGREPAAQHTRQGRRGLRTWRRVSPRGAGNSVGLLSPLLTARDHDRFLHVCPEHYKHKAI